ncbi:MAG: hypothetical protein R2824_28290 [Saprospiraceae bacterium]|nr:hypothetical protein [Lewinella sp.]
MRTGKVSYLSDLHFDHTQWRSELAFWDYELNFMDRQLTGIIENSRKQKVLARAEHFQNAFAIHREEMSRLRHKISWHEEQLARVAQLLPSKIEQQHFHDHQALRSRFDDQRTLFRQLKDEFFSFLEEQIDVAISIM